MTDTRAAMRAAMQMPGTHSCTDACPTKGPHSGIVSCDTCGELHAADYSHQETVWNGVQHVPTGREVYAVVCEQDGLTDYYTTERLFSA